MVKNSSLLKNIYIYYILYFLIIPFGFLIRMLYSNTITPVELGIFYSLIAFFGFFMIFSNLGFSQSLQYHIPKYEVRKEFNKIRDLFYYSYFLQILLVAIISAVLFIFSKEIAIFYFGKEEVAVLIRIFILYFISVNIMQRCTDLLLAFRLSSISQSLYFLQMLLLFVISLSFVLNNSSDLLLKFAYIWAFVYIFIAILYNLVVFSKNKYLLSFPKYDRKLFMKFMKYSRHVFIGGLTFSAFSQIDIIMITYFLTFVDVANYSNSFSLVEFLTSLFTAVIFILIPYISELKEKGDINTIKFYISTVYSYIFYFSIPFLFVLGLFSGQILSLLFGEAYSSAGLILTILSIFSILKILNSYNVAFLHGLGLAKRIPKAVVSGIILNIFLNYVLLKIMGIIGIVIGTVVSWSFVFILLFIIVRKETGVKIDYWKSLKIIFSILLFSLMILTLKDRLYILNPIISSLTIASLSYLFYIALGYFLKIYTFKDLSLFLPDKFRKYFR